MSRPAGDASLVCRDVLVAVLRRRSGRKGFFAAACRCAPEWLYDKMFE